MTAPNLEIKGCIQKQQKRAHFEYKEAFSLDFVYF